MSNSLSPCRSNSVSSFPFLFCPACGSSSSTSWSAIVVLSPLLKNIFNEQHWNLVSIVFMVAKLGKKILRTQNLCPGSKNVFDWRGKEEKTFFVSEQQNLFPQHMLHARLNWKTFALATINVSARMFPSLARP